MRRLVRVEVGDRLVIFAAEQLGECAEWRRAIAVGDRLAEIDVAAVLELIRARPELAAFVKPEASRDA